MPIESEGIDSLYTLRNLGLTGIKDLEWYLNARNSTMVGFTNTDLIALRDKLLQVYPIGGSQSVVSNNQSVPVTNSALVAVPGTHTLSVVSGVVSHKLDALIAALQHNVQLNVAVTNNVAVAIGTKCVPTVSAGVLTGLQILP